MQRPSFPVRKGVRKRTSEQISGAAEAARSSSSSSTNSDMAEVQAPRRTEGEGESATEAGPGTAETTVQAEPVR